MDEVTLGKERIVAGLAGDWHGRAQWAMATLDFFADNGINTVYHAGDFGLWPGIDGKAYLADILTVCAERKITLWITPGNHDDYSQIDDPADPDGGLDRQVLGAGDGWEVALLPRGYSWEYGGKSFVSFGGAASIDYQQRTEGKDWWKDEMIRPSDLARLPRSEGADVMICHDAPDGGTVEVQKIIDTPAEKSYWSEAGLRYAAEGRMLMNEAIAIVKPRVFVHGHYHVTDERYDEDKDCLYVSLGMDGDTGNVALLHLDDKIWIQRPITR